MVKSRRATSFYPWESEMAYKSEEAGPEDPFVVAYRAYLEAVKQAWAEVDIDVLVRARKDAFERYDCAGSVSTIGTIWCLACGGGTLGTAGTIGSIAVKPEKK